MTCTEIQEFITLGLTYASKFLNSTFTLSFVGALAGAAAGGLAAQRVIEKSKLREESLKEIRNTHAAVMVAFSICNTALLLKKQLVQPMFDRFSEAHTGFIKYREERASGKRQGGAPYQVQLDLQEYMAPALAIETLKSLVFDKVSAFGRPLMLVAQIENASNGLAGSIAKRARVIEDFKTTPPASDVLALQYFGEMLPSGHTHREYADIVEVIHSYTNDLIFFSGLLASDLAAHGKSRGEAFFEKFGKGAPVVDAPDFTGPKKTGLYPPDSDYSALLNWVVDKAAVPQ